MKTVSLCILALLLSTACHSGNRNSSIASESSPNISLPEGLGSDISWESGEIPPALPPVEVTNIKVKDSGLSAKVDSEDSSSLILSGKATASFEDWFIGSLSFNVDGRNFYVETREGESAREVLEDIARSFADYGYRFEISAEGDGSQKIKVSRTEDNDAKTHATFVPYSVRVFQSSPGILHIEGETKSMQWKHSAKTNLKDRTITIVFDAYENGLSQHIFDPQYFRLDLTPPAGKTVLKGSYQVIANDVHGDLLFSGEVVID